MFQEPQTQETVEHRCQEGNQSQNQEKGAAAKMPNASVAPSFEVGAALLAGAHPDVEEIVFGEVPPHLHGACRKGTPENRLAERTAATRVVPMDVFHSVPSIGQERSDSM